MRRATCQKAYTSRRAAGSSPRSSRSGMKACWPRARLRLRVISSDGPAGAEARGSPATSFGVSPWRKSVHGMSCRQKALSEEATSER